MGDSYSTRSDAKGKGRATPNGGMLALDLEHAEGGMGVPNRGNNSAFQQMELVEQQVRSLPRFMAHKYRERVILTCLQRWHHAGQLHTIALHRHRVD